jgi:hypothetical protein
MPMNGSGVVQPDGGGGCGEGGAGFAAADTAKGVAVTCSPTAITCGAGIGVDRGT